MGFPRKLRPKRLDDLMRRSALKNTSQHANSNKDQTDIIPKPYKPQVDQPPSQEGFKKASRLS